MAKGDVPAKRLVKWFGWLPDLPDRRDRLRSVSRSMLANPPRKVDLRSQCPPIQDQGDLGSCVAHAVSGAIEFDRQKQKLDPLTPSRLFIYYNARRIERTINSDAGCMMRDAIKSVASQGAAPETDWPYEIVKYRERPPEQAYTDAAQHPALLYERVRQEDRHVKATLAEGFPVTVGLSLYKSFDTDAVAKSGIVPYPKVGERQIGGHGVLIVGYDDNAQRFIVRNSWGTDWGIDGYFLIPYTYVLDPNLADDLWTIKLVA